MITNYFHLDQITERCTEVETGARNIEYILNGNVLPQLSKTILGAMAEGEMPSHVRMDVAEDGSFTMDFKEPAEEEPEAAPAEETPSEPADEPEA